MHRQVWRADADSELARAFRRATDQGRTHANARCALLVTADTPGTHAHLARRRVEQPRRVSYLEPRLLRNAQTPCSVNNPGSTPSCSESGMFYAVLPVGTRIYRCGPSSEPPLASAAGCAHPPGRASALSVSCPPCKPPQAARDSRTASPASISTPSADDIFCRIHMYLLVDTHPDRAAAAPRALQPTDRFLSAEGAAVRRGHPARAPRRARCSAAASRLRPRLADTTRAADLHAGGLRADTPVSRLSPRPSAHAGHTAAWEHVSATGGGARVGLPETRGMRGWKC